MSRNIKREDLVRIARRSGTVRWRKSGRVELLALRADGVIMATSQDESKLHPLDMTYERFNCSEVGAPLPAPKVEPTPVPAKKPLKSSVSHSTPPKQRFDARREQTVQVLQRRSR